MKKLYLMGLVGLLCAACSNDDFPGEEQSQNQNLTGQERFMSVQLVSPEGTSSRASRADGDHENGTTTESYKDGLATESEVGTLTDGTQDITFYFFDADGNPCCIDETATQNWSHPYSVKIDGVNYDGNPTWTASTDVHLTKVSSASIMLHNAQAIPVKVVAVLNGNGKFTTEQNYTLSELADVTVTTGYTEATSTTADKDFLMSNSVYMDETSKTAIQATEITSDNIWSNAKDASLNPVKIYVERAVAKVEAKSDKADADGYLKVLKAGSTTDEPETDANGNALYVKFDKWTTFDVSQKAYNLKHIDTTYNPTGDDAWTWNEPAAFRSFWAEKNTFDIVKQKLTYNEINTAFGADHYCYPFENTQGINTAEGRATKVILAAKLYTKGDDGTYAPATVCEFLGIRYTLADLKTQIAGMLAKKIYKIHDGETSGTSITADNIDFDALEGEYRVKVKLVPDAGQATTFVKPDNGALSDTERDAILATIPHIKIWKDGRCYYYTYIKHLNGQNAVIRNHWYQVNVTKVTGLGTPVYDPENNTFDPERPEDDEWVLGAEIHIQSWRMVSQDYDLGSAITDDDKNEKNIGVEE
jgi:hypothetical protein